MGAERRQSEFTLMPYEDGWRLYFEHVSERQTQVSVMEVGNKPKKICLSSDFRVFLPIVATAQSICDRLLKKSGLQKLTSGLETHL